MKFMILKRGIHWGLVLFACLSMIGARDPGVPPVEIPLNLGQVGSVYTFDVKVVERLTYSVVARFYVTLPNKWSHFFDKESPEESRRLFRLLGGAKVEGQTWIDSGVPAKFRVQIIDKSSGSILLDQLTEHPETESTYMGRYAILGTKSLAVGVYTIRVEYLEGAPELAPLHGKILFGRAHHGK